MAASNNSGNRSNGNSGIGLTGQISEFNIKDDDFSAWVERFELFILLNEVNVHKKKLMFLTFLGNDGYSLLRDLCIPSKPIDKGYDSLKELLSNYINPKPNLLTERYKFKERKQRSEETIHQFVASLKKLSQFCEFGVNLDDSLRDQVVYGIKDVHIKKRLLSETKLTFKRSVELSLSMEAADKDVSKWESQELNYQKFMKTKNNKSVKDWGKGKLKTEKKESSKGMSGKIVCFCCGVVGHTKPNCKYKSLVCSNCSKVGHLKKVCKIKKSNVNLLEQVNNNLNDDFGDLNVMDNIYLLDSVDCNFIKPFNIKLNVGGNLINFQIDTGSSITAISYDEFMKVKFKTKDLINSDISLKGYTGTLIEPVGFLRVKVLFKDHVVQDLKLYIIKGNGPPIVGRDWIDRLSIPLTDKVYSLTSYSHDSIFKEFSSVFSTVLGCYKPKTFKLYLNDNVKPVFCKPRVLPFTLKDKTSERATPVVPVVKGDGTIRLCGDYKVTLNKFLKVDRYPIPRVSDLMATLQGASKFCILDLCQAYQQLLLDEDSQKLTTLSTHKGLYVFKRIPYGIASAPGILQREMENVLRDIDGTVAFYDDIIISGKSEEEVCSRLKEVLSKLSLVGFTVKKEKCKLFKDSVTFLGYKIDKDGLHVPETRVKAITAAPIPCNVSQLKAFLGLVTYYGKFIKNMSTIANPLYKLLKNNTAYEWGNDQNKAFDGIKKALLSKEILIHYNPKWPIILACDASPTGIGAVLSHKLPDESEKPIAFISRTLSSSERGYAQIDKEATAIVYAIKYFHQFLYGREFILRTDHKPLVMIFGPKKGIPVMAANRLQRYAIFLSGYNYEIQFIKGTDNGNADALSRLSLEFPDNANNSELDNYSINLITENIKSISDLDICLEVKKHPLLREVFLRVFTGKWDDIKVVSEDMKPYFNRRNEFSIEKGFLLWGHRLVIPPKYRTALLAELHNTHLGIVKMKSIARSYIWWPGIDSDIESITKECMKCLAYSENPPRSILHSWPYPDGPSQRVHLDFLGPVNGKMFIVIIDAFSKWIFVKHMLNITTSSTIKVLCEYFAYCGVPAKLVTDNGSSLCSKEMIDFLKKNRVFHITTPPYNPSTNGAAENLVRTFKNFIKKCKSNSDIEMDIFKFVLSYNSTKHCATGVSPAELHLGRLLPTPFDRLNSFAKYNYNKGIVVAKNNYRGCREKVYLIKDTVMCKNYGTGDVWVPGIILKILSPVTYLVDVGNGMVWKRHVNQIIDRVITKGSEVETLNDGRDDKSTVDNKQIELDQEVASNNNNVSLDSVSKDTFIRKSGRTIKPPKRLNL
ncbi:unnamed protein product [Macrosiphum euphorbiae]|uniref:RNA-directed DNA polymerase n=1 Tax=Macrosiphum euphorbiae TaxID=13131 RepID=A0AAV0XBQ0_9HEMI|nr:unnamed protein product [Macrosiphum euphorbiae]